jgi:hypothetical protein
MFDEPGGLRIDGRRNGEVPGVRTEDGAPPGVARCVAVGSGDEDTRVDQQHPSDAFGQLRVGGVTAHLGDVQGLVGAPMRPSR